MEGHLCSPAVSAVLQFNREPLLESLASNMMNQMYCRCTNDYYISLSIILPLISLLHISQPVRGHSCHVSPAISLRDEAKNNDSRAESMLVGRWEAPNRLPWPA